MGCFWSSEERERCYSCGRYAVNNLVIIQHQCECCRSRREQQEKSVALLQNHPRFGEYRCPCGRFWSSCLSWPNKYQICKNCGRRVMASYQRELRPSDHTEVSEKREKHAQELCEECKRLGKYCGSYRQGVPSRNGFRGRRGPQRQSKALSTRKY